MPRKPASRMAQALHFASGTRIQFYQHQPLLNLTSTTTTTSPLQLHAIPHTMQTTDTITNPAPVDHGNLLGRIKEMLAYIVCPVGRRPPNSSDIARLATSPLDKFHVGAMRLIKAAAKMFAMGSNREMAEVHPWYRLGRMERGEGPGVHTNQNSVVNWRAELDAAMAEEDERLDRLEKGWGFGEVVGLKPESQDAAHTSLRAVANNRVIDAQAPGGAQQPPCANSTDTDPTSLGDELIVSIEEFLEELQSDHHLPLQPDLSLPTPKCNAEARQPGNKTQPLRKQVLKRLLPKFTKRTVTPLRCDTKVPRSVGPRDSTERSRTQTVSPHYSLASKHEVRRKPGYSCSRLETLAAAAPNHEKLGCSTAASEDAKHPPREHVKEVNTAASGLGTSGVASLNVLPKSTARDATLKKASIPPNTPKVSHELNLASLQAAIDATAALQAFIEDEYSTPSRSCSSTEVSNSEALLAETVASRRSKVAHGRPTCMGDWLAQLGTGTNSLVDEEIAMQAAQLVEIMRPSLPSLSPMSTPSPSTSSCTSGSSTPEDTPPITPTSVIEPTSAWPMTERSEAARRSRARCSYDGSVFDSVIAPEVPEDLLTEEVGVAC